MTGVSRTQPMDAALRHVRLANKNWLLHSCHWDAPIIATVDGKTMLIAETDARHADLIIEACNSHASLKARIEEQQKVCDSYAEENQRFHDRIEELESAVAFFVAFFEDQPGIKLTIPGARLERACAALSAPAAVGNEK